MTLAYFQVIPEPSTWALVLLGVGAAATAAAGGAGAEIVPTLRLLTILFRAANSGQIGSVHGAVACNFRPYQPRW